MLPIVFYQREIDTTESRILAHSLVVSASEGRQSHDLKDVTRTRVLFIEHICSVIWPPMMTVVMNIILTQIMVLLPMMSDKSTMSGEGWEGSTTGSLVMSNRKSEDSYPGVRRVTKKLQA